MIQYAHPLGEIGMLKFDDDRQTDMRHPFKKANGYTELEISQKRTALENVLIPETFSQQRGNDHNKVGFNSAETWFQYFTCPNHRPLRKLRLSPSTSSGRTVTG